MAGDHSNPNIFLSYSWANIAVADTIDKDFSSIGITLMRDQREAGYRSSLAAYMQRTTKSDFVVILISDEFLRSEYCMYEMTELLNTHEFEKRILPVSLENAQALFNSKTRTVYYDYWKQELATADKLLHDYLNADYVNQKKKIESICIQLDDFFLKLTDFHILPFEELRKLHYKPMLDIIGFDKELFMDELIAINNLDEPEDQEIALDEFLEKHPGNEHAYFIKAVLATTKKEYKIARRLYEKVMTVNPAAPIANNNLALLYQHYLPQEADEPPNAETAKKLYEKEIALNPRFDAAYYNLAVLLETKLKAFDEAKKRYLQAIAVNPQYMKAHYNLANLLVRHDQDYQLAKEHYEKAIAINPGHAGSHSNLGLILKLNFKDFKGAKEQFEKALAINPDLAVAHYQIAELLLFEHLDISDAKDHYQKATTLDPSLIKKELDLLFEIKR